VDRSFNMLSFIATRPSWPFVVLNDVFSYKHDQLSRFGIVSLMLEMYLLHNAPRSHCKSVRTKCGVIGLAI
jgi:hypothetical protein